MFLPFAPSPLRCKGHDVTSARDAGTTRLPDDAQFLHAALQRRTLVTHNREDFVLLHDAWTAWPGAFGPSLPAHPGIVALDAAESDTLFHAIDALLSSIHPDGFANGLFQWRRHDLWRQRAAGHAWTQLAV